MASLNSPLRALSRARISWAAFDSAGNSIAGPSRLAAAAFTPARAGLTTFANVPTQHRSGISRIASQASFRRWNSSAAAAPGAAHKAIVEEEGESSTGESNPGGDLRLEAPAAGAKPQQLAQIQPRLSLTFTCTADACNHRSTHKFSKQAYTKGIVLVQCPSCKNRHLIADHLGWFKESTEEGTLKTIEDLLRAKGETVRTGRVNWDGDIEYDGETKA